MTAFDRADDGHAFKVTAFAAGARLARDKFFKLLFRPCFFRHDDLLQAARLMMYGGGEAVTSQGKRLSLQGVASSKPRGHMGASSC